MKDKKYEAARFLKYRVTHYAAIEAVPKLGPPPAKAAELVTPDIEEAWRVRDAMMVLSKGDREFADRQFEKMRVRTQEKRHDTKRSNRSS